MSRTAIALVVLALLLAGCGFQLQGAITVPAEMERTYIQTDDHYSKFYLALRREFEAAGISVVDTAAAATAIFTIYFDSTDQRVLSVSARNVPTEFEVYYSVEYGLISGQETLLQAQEMTLTRDYTYDATQVLGKAREEELLRDAIVQDLVRIILKQVAVR